MLAQTRHHACRNKQRGSQLSQDARTAAAADNIVPVPLPCAKQATRIVKPGCVICLIDAQYLLVKIDGKQLRHHAQLFGTDAQYAGVTTNTVHFLLHHAAVCSHHVAHGNHFSCKVATCFRVHCTPGALQRSNAQSSNVECSKSIVAYQFQLLAGATRQRIFLLFSDDVCMATALGWEQAGSWGGSRPAAEAQT